MGPNIQEYHGKPYHEQCSCQNDDDVAYYAVPVVKSAYERLVGIHVANLMIFFGRLAKIANFAYPTLIL